MFKRLQYDIKQVTCLTNSTAMKAKSFGSQVVEYGRVEVSKTNLGELRPK